VLPEDVRTVGGSFFEPSTAAYDSQMQFFLWYDGAFDSWATTVLDDFSAELVDPDVEVEVTNEVVLATVYSGYSLGVTHNTSRIPGPQGVADDFDLMVEAGNAGMYIGFCLTETVEAPEENAG